MRQNLRKKPSNSRIEQKLAIDITPFIQSRVRAVWFSSFVVFSAIRCSLIYAYRAPSTLFQGETLMKKIQSMLSRYRLLTSVLALALALGALAATPATAQDMLAEGGGWKCESMGCVLWSYNVCYTTRICCVNGLGGYKCYDS